VQLVCVCAAAAAAAAESAHPPTYMATNSNATTMQELPRLCWMASCLGCVLLLVLGILRK